MINEFTTNQIILENYDKIPFDILLETYVSYCTNGVMIIRYDLESYIKGHFGLFFQDRDRFPSIIGTD